MRALRWSRAQVLAAQRAEFAVLGAIAGLLGSFGATAIGWTPRDTRFQLDFIGTLDLDRRPRAPASPASC